MIDFYFDCSSPWSYLAFRNIQPLDQKSNAAVDFAQAPLAVNIVAVFGTVAVGGRP